MKVLVIGGGAAGMMAALAAADAGAEVTLLEKNEKLGKKLFITGKGRCNVTNACDRDEFFTHIFRNPRFLYSAFGRFGNYDMMDLMESCGVPLKTERGNRVFPQSDKSSDIIRGLENALRERGVSVRLNTRVTSLILKGGAVTGAHAEEKKSGRSTKLEFAADRVIAATGGLAYPSTGAVGDGYVFAEKAGHSIVPTGPSLVPVNAVFAGKASGISVKTVMGLSLKNVSARFTQGGKELAYDFGEMLFTHFGVSGPIILSCSGLIGEALEKDTVKAKGEVLLHLDLKPALTAEQLDARYLRESEGAGLKQISTFLGSWLPKALIPVVLAAAGVPETRKIAELTKKERESLLGTMKDLVMRADSLRGYDEAIVTRGGISVKELVPATMESKKIKHLYFAGEVLDLDGETGGFNLQIAWSTGHAAGAAAAKEE